MEAKKTIWFVNKDAAPIDVYATHLRTVKQAQYFQQQGYDVKLICSANVHNKDIDYVDKGWYVEQTHDGVPFVFVKSLHYGNSSIKRILAYMLFSLNVNRLCRKMKSPDIIIHTSRIPFDYPIYLLAKRKKARYILDITDLWPLQFERFGFLAPQNPILKWFYNIEKYLYSRAEHVVISMEGGQQYIREHKWDLESGGKIDLNKIHYVNNGIDLEELRTNTNTYSLEDADLEDDSIQKIIYLGSIRRVNNLESLINAAASLKEHKNLKVLIFGDGTERAMLEEKVRKEGIDNVVFKNKWIEPKYVPYVLSKASINVLNYGKGFGRYGGSMNKMFMAIACGKPILCNIGMAYSPIKDYQLGIDRAIENPEDYTSAIEELLNLSEKERFELFERSQVAAQQFDIPYLNRKFQTCCNL